MENLIIIAVLILIVGGILLYLRKEKNAGRNASAAPTASNAQANASM